MEAWYFTEMPYPHIPPHDEIEAMRVSLPNAEFDPVLGGQLYNRYLDEYMLADELGLEIMVNEHHATPVCINSAAPVRLTTITRLTSGHWVSATSVLRFRGTVLPPRRPSSAVITTSLAQMTGKVPDLGKRGYGCMRRDDPQADIGCVSHVEKLGGVETREIRLHFLNGRLYQFSMSAEVQHYDAVIAQLRARNGAPQTGGKYAKA